MVEYVEFERASEQNEWDVVDWMEFNGVPTLEDLHRAEQAGTEFARQVKQFAKGAAPCDAASSEGST